MTGWEYKVVFESYKTIEQTLNRYGQDGWELVGFSGGAHVYAVLKRPLSG